MSTIETEAVSVKEAAKRKRCSIHTIKLNLRLGKLTKSPMLVGGRYVAGVDAASLKEWKPTDTGLRCRKTKPSG